MPQQSWEMAKHGWLLNGRQQKISRTEGSVSQWRWNDGPKVERREERGVAVEIPVGGIVLRSASF
jgi:hypothetical protein